MIWRVIYPVIALGMFPLWLPAQGAQDWNAPRVVELIQRATARRAAQLADTGLRTYKAEARGYLTFLAQLGEGFREPPKIVRTDQIASDVYWRAPNFSKQMIKGRRDTLLLPTDIRYHRDHLGIVQNNFPSFIRLGDGDEVEDVPHPLSAFGLREYDFALRDSLQIRIGPRTLAVYEIRVRPKNDRAPRAVGTVFIDRESGDVVRMALSFTRAALKDKELEDVSVVLENSLVEGRFWLPRTQEIEIRRTGTWLDYPARGIIRGRWEIDDYDVNVPVNVDFNGPEIVPAPGSRITRSGAITSPGFTFHGGILDSLPPDVSVTTDADVQRVQNEARELVRAQALARGRSVALSGHRVSDFVHANRVEGMAVGAGVLQPIGSGLAVGGHTMYGFSDHTWKWRGSLLYRRPSGASIELGGYDVLGDASDIAERSGTINTLAAQNFGSDYTEPYRARGGSIRLQSATIAALRVSASVAVERHDSVSVHASPAIGTFERTLSFLPWRESRATIGFDIPTRSIVGGGEGSATLTVSGIRGHTLTPGSPDRDFGRATLVIDATKPAGHTEFVFRTIGAAVSNGPSIPVEHLVYFGGPVTAPGYDFHTLVSRIGVSQRVEWQVKVPFVGIPLGAWGRAPANLTLAPYVNAAWLRGTTWKPSVGVGALTIFDLLRFDVARGVGKGGRWMFGFDVNRAFWSVL